MNIAELAPRYVRSLSPYQPGKPISELARELRLSEASIIKLASNENPLGMSPKAKQAALSALEDTARYPDGNGFALKQALVTRYGIAMQQIVLGNGSNDVLELVARAFLAPGLAAIYAQHAFAVYPLVTKAIGATGIEVAAQEYGHDLFAMLAAITPETRMIFIANPNNPTGTLLGGDLLLRFLGEVPGHIVVVLDEAYNEYLPPAMRYDSLPWLARFPNLVVTRTFSKVYGLAGLRVGFALASAEVADLMNRLRQPFNVSSVALAAAEAALTDDEFVARSFELNARGMQQVTAGLLDLGLEHISSYGNFISFRVGDADSVNRSLLRQGVIVRPIAAYGMAEHLRATIGLDRENARFLEALERALS